VMTANTLRPSGSNDPHAPTHFWRRGRTTPTLQTFAPIPYGEPNITLKMKMGRENPKLRQLVDRSLTTAQAWAQEELAEGEKQAGEIQAHRIAAQRLLATK